MFTNTLVALKTSCEQARRNCEHCGCVPTHVVRIDLSTSTPVPYDNTTRVEYNTHTTSVAKDKRKKMPHCAQRTLFERHWSAARNKTPTLRKRYPLEHNISRMTPYHHQPNATPSRALVYTEALLLLPCCYWTRNAIHATMFLGISLVRMTARHIQSACSHRNVANDPGFAFRPCRLVLSPTQRRSLRGC